MKRIIISTIIIVLFSNITTATTFNIIDTGVEISGSVNIWDPQGNYMDGNSYDITDTTSAFDDAYISAAADNDEWTVLIGAFSGGRLSYSNSHIYISSSIYTNLNIMSFDMNPSSPRGDAMANSFVWVTFNFNSSNEFVELYGEATLETDAVRLPGNIKLFDLTASEWIYFSEIFNPEEPFTEIYKGIASLDTSHTYKFIIEKSAYTSEGNQSHTWWNESGNSYITIIPEPATLSLLALGAFWAGRKRRKIIVEQYENVLTIDLFKNLEDGNMKKTVFVFGIICFLFFANPILNAGTIYGIQGSWFYEFDPATGNTDFLGDVVYTVNKLTYDSNNNILYGVYGSYLYSIDYKNTTSTFLGDMVYTIDNLVYNPNTDTMYGTYGSYLYSIDPVNVSAQLMGDLTNTIRALAYDPYNNIIYGSYGSNLFTVDPINITSELLGDVIMTISDALTFNLDDGYLYGAGGSSLSKVNPTNLISELLGVDYPHFKGLAFIPEPTTLSLFALGAMLAGRKRRK